MRQAVRLEPDQTYGGDIAYIRGVPWVLQGQGDIGVGVASLEADEIALAIEFFNGTKNQRVDIRPERIEVMADGKPLYVFSPSEYQMLMRNGQNTQMLWASALLGVREAGAGRGRASTNSSGPFDWSTHDSGGHGSLDGTTGSSSTTTQDDPVARPAATARNQAVPNQGYSRPRKALASSDGLLLKATTLFPGQSISGVVYARHIEAEQYTVIVPVGNKTFHIGFAPAR